MRIVLPLALMLFSCDSSFATDNPSLPAFPLWLSPNASDAKDHDAELEGHPCGTVIFVKTDFLPAYSEQARYQPERVFELDSERKIIRTWVTPVDAYPVGLRGETLFFQYREHVYSVNVSGQIRRAETADEFPAPADRACPRPNQTDPSLPTDCVAFMDLSRKQWRVLTFEPVCS